MENINEKKIIKFLETHPLISVRGLEKESEIPNDTIKKALEGKRGLPEKHLKKIIVVLKKYGYK